MTKYHNYWLETLKTPDFFGYSKKHKDCKIYILKNNKSRNFLAKFLIVVVNDNHLITSIRFASNLDFVNNLRKL